MRNLKISEVQEVSGGVVPVIIGIVLVDLFLIGVTAGMASGAEDQASESGHNDQCSAN